MQSGGSLKQTMLMDDFTGSAGAFSMIIDGNTFNEINGSWIFYSAINNPMNLFSSLIVRNNSASNNSGDGLVKLDAPAPIASFGTTTITIKNQNNIVTHPSITAPGFATAFTPDTGLCGYNTAVITSIAGLTFI